MMNSFFTINKTLFTFLALVFITSLTFVFAQEVEATSVPETDVLTEGDIYTVDTTATSVPAVQSKVELAGHGGIHVGPMTKKELQLQAKAIKASSAKKTLDLSQTTGLTEIPKGTFAGCVNLESIVLPNGIKRIGAKAFSDCRSLTQIEIPQGITTIGAETFAGCSKLTSVIIPSSVTVIEKSAFKDCTQLKSITFPDKLKEIKSSAFEGCSSITSIDIPANTKLGDGIFARCKSLSSVNLPKGIPEITKNLFDGCEKLAAISIPKGTKTINEKAFANCKSLTTVDLSENITKIGAKAFDSCKGLNTINVAATTPPELANKNVFNGCNSLKAILVPTYSVNWYKHVWSSVAKNIEPDNK